MLSCKQFKFEVKLDEVRRRSVERLMGQRRVILC